MHPKTLLLAWILTYQGPEAALKEFHSSTYQLPATLYVDRSIPPEDMGRIFLKVPSTNTRLLPGTYDYNPGKWGIPRQTKRQEPTN